MPHLPLLVGASAHPVLHWDLDTDALTVDGRPLAPRALFLRHDVFTNLQDGRPDSASRAYSWFTTLLAWAAAHPRVRLLNREHTAFVLKPQQLLAARDAGLAIPSTLVSNDAAALDALADDRIVKPVAGGDFTVPLAPVLAKAPRRGGAFAAPAIVQQRLVPPELRVYRIGERFVSFHVIADALDYRTVSNARVERVRNDRRLVAGLRRLTDALRLDFGAADFKKDPASGRMLFLEVNSSPMFAAFDAASDGAISRAIVRAIVTRPHAR
ncbi:MAG TPA: hypothetical protein VF432_23540 [Thermoanaerobaculia bacterium]